MNMTHSSNNIQDLHEKMQTSLSRTVESETRFISKESDSTFLDQTLEKLTAERAEFNTHLQNFVSNDTMGGALKKHKKELKHTTNNNEDTTPQNHVDFEQNSEASDHIPSLILSDTTGSDQCIINYENINSKHNDTETSLDNSKENEVTQTDSNSSTIPSNLNPEEPNEQSKRDSAYGSSLESSQVSANSETISPTENHTSESNCNDPSKIILSDLSFPSALLANKWSSTSSLASERSVDGTTSPHDCENSTCSSFLSSKEPMHLRNLSSSSNFSLRSSLSLESEDDCGDEPNRQKQAKPPRRDGWKKLRQIVWSPFMQSFKKKYPWVQLAGHAGNFQPGEEGCILKKYVEREAECLRGLTEDQSLQGFAPTFHGIVNLAEEKYTRMQDLLLPFDNPSLMDCKMGIRTYLENELIQAREKPRLRNDMYKKMVEISPNEPTEEERKQQAVTKPRYMQWREHVSSTSNLGFRIEGIKKSSQIPSKDYKLTKTSAQVIEAFKYFIEKNTIVLSKYIERLKQISETLENSDFFHSHEAIGSSLLFVHDDTGLANIWMIDFGKTSRLPGNQKVDHRSEWIEGNREDGYLFGVDNMIQLFKEIQEELGPAPEVIPVGLPPKPDVSSNVDIVVTAPSPISLRKGVLRRQAAEAASDDHLTHDVTDDTSKKT